MYSVTVLQVPHLPTTLQSADAADMADYAVLHELLVTVHTSGILAQVNACGAGMRLLALRVLNEVQKCMLSLTVAVPVQCRSSCSYYWGSHKLASK